MVHELTLERMSQWPNSIKNSLFLCFGLCIMLLGYSLIIQDNWALYQRAKAAEFVLRVDFEKKQRQGVQLTEYRQQLKQINDYYFELIKKLAEQNKLTALFEEISQTGLDSGLKFELFAPQAEVAQDFYTEIPINLSVLGGYRQFAVFLSKLVTIKGILNVRELTVQQLSSKDQEEVSEDQFQMNMILTLHQYKKS